MQSQTVEAVEIVQAIGAHEAVRGGGMAGCVPGLAGTGGAPPAPSMALPQRPVHVDETGWRASNGGAPGAAGPRCDHGVGKAGRCGYRQPAVIRGALDGPRGHLQRNPPGAEWKPPQDQTRSSQA